MGIYCVTKRYRVEARNYIRDNCEKLHSPHVFFCLESPTKIKSEIHACLKSVVWDPLNKISLSVDKELGKSNVSLLYHILMKMFRRGLIIRCWRFLLETIMVYSGVFWRYLPENLSWFSTIKLLKVSSCGLCEKTV